jgi:protein disulfide-isomerase-like protein
MSLHHTLTALLLAALLAPTAIVASPPHAAETLAAAPGVERLVARNFNTKLSQHDAALVEFYAPWCGHCKALEPEYAAAAARLAAKQQPSVGLFKVDAVEQQALAAKFGIQSYPTIKLFYGNQEVEKYDGERKADALVAYMIEKASAAPRNLPREAENQEASTQGRPAAGRVLSGVSSSVTAESVATRDHGYRATPIGATESGHAAKITETAAVDAASDSEGGAAHSMCIAACVVVRKWSLWTPAGLEAMVPWLLGL